MSNKFDREEYEERMGHRRKSLAALLARFRYQSSRPGVGKRSLPAHVIDALVEYLA